MPLRTLAMMVARSSSVRLAICFDSMGLYECAVDGESFTDDGDDRSVDGSELDAISSSPSFTVSSTVAPECKDVEGVSSVISISVESAVLPLIWWSKNSCAH